MAFGTKEDLRKDAPIIARIFLLSILIVSTFHGLVFYFLSGAN